MSATAALDHRTSQDVWLSPESESVSRSAWRLLGVGWELGISTSMTESAWSFRSNALAQQFRDLANRCARPDGSPTHAARQLPDGTWTSKLGKDVDISHDSLDGLSGDRYGTPALILRRREGEGTVRSKEPSP